MFCSRTLQQGAKPASAWLELPVLELPHTALCARVRISHHLHILVVCFFLIKLVRPQCCISPAPSSSPTWSPLTNHPQGAESCSLTPSEEHWPIVMEKQDEQDECSEDTPVWEKLNVLSKHRGPKPQTSVGNMKTAHNGN